MIKIKKKYDNNNANVNKQKKIGSYKKFDPIGELLDVSKKNENNIKKYLYK